MTFDLHTSAIALFVWLDMDVTVGTFSDNGFIMVDQTLSLTFTSLYKLPDVQVIQDRLTVKSLIDIY